MRTRTGSIFTKNLVMGGKQTNKKTINTKRSQSMFDEVQFSDFDFTGNSSADNVGIASVEHVENAEPLETLEDSKGNQKGYTVSNGEYKTMYSKACQIIIKRKNPKQIRKMY